MRKSEVLVLLGLIIAAGTQASAGSQDLEPEMWPDPPAELEMLPVEGLDQDPLSPKIGNGSVADPTQWPASFYGVFRIGTRKVSCTATLLGPRTLLTAAHCIAPKNGSVRIDRRKIDPTSSIYRGTCERPSDGYPSKISLDVAMCLMDDDVPAHRYERIEIGQSLFNRDMRLLLAGFGCTEIGGRSDGVFRTGPAFVEHLPGGLKRYPYWVATYAAIERGDAFICKGDSGGAVFVEQLAADRRTVLAVNSHYDTAGKGVSFLTALSVPKVAKFIRDWARIHGQRLCGVHENAPNCR